MDDAVLNELCSAPLDEFVARRTALAKELKAEGRTDEAAEVSGTRKPTVPVWAANQLARRNRPAVEKLLSASDALRTAIGKGDRDAFSTAQKAQSDALSATVNPRIAARRRRLSRCFPADWGLASTLACGSAAARRIASQSTPASDSSPG